ncbi:MAG: hypothetical protein ACJAX5_001187 [Patiriisocius sp.]|jgi:hypothetical protein
MIITHNRHRVTCYSLPFAKTMTGNIARHADSFQIFASFWQSIKLIMIEQHTHREVYIGLQGYESKSQHQRQGKFDMVFSRFEPQAR